MALYRRYRRPSIVVGRNQKLFLHRYLAEFDFRYSNRVALGIDDAKRADNAIKGIVGKRLTYRTTRARRPGAESRVVW